MTIVDHILNTFLSIIQGKKNSPLSRRNQDVTRAIQNFKVNARPIVGLLAVRYQCAINVYLLGESTVLQRYKWKPVGSASEGGRTKLRSTSGINLYNL